MKIGPQHGRSHSKKAKRLLVGPKKLPYHHPSSASELEWERNGLRAYLAKSRLRAPKLVAFLPDPVPVAIHVFSEELALLGVVAQVVGDRLLLVEAFEAILVDVGEVNKLQCTHTKHAREIERGDTWR